MVPVASVPGPAQLSISGGGVGEGGGGDLHAAMRNWSWERPGNEARLNLQTAVYERPRKATPLHKSEPLSSDS